MEHIVVPSIRGRVETRSDGSNYETVEYAIAINSKKISGYLLK
jgi:hypothetical protein